ncbi:hypothetical protein H4R20_007019, partial [Coemansia guatemalensis]
MKFAAALSISPTLLLLASVASGYYLNDLSEYANCRAEPNTTSAVVKQFKAGEYIDIECQVSGERVFDYAIWDKTQDNCYLTDYYVDTGKSSDYVTKNCLYQGPNPGRPCDDYRYKDQCDEVDPWNYYIC